MERANLGGVPGLLDWTKTPEAMHTAARMVRLLGLAINEVEARRPGQAESLLNEDMIRDELAGVPHRHLGTTMDALRRITGHMRSRPEPRIMSARLELRQLLNFWTDGWKR